MYTDINFPTKKALKDALARGDKLTIYQPGDIFTMRPTSGTYSVEGPHFPKPHRWYAEVVVKDGIIVQVK